MGINTLSYLRQCYLLTQESCWHRHQTVTFVSEGGKERSPHPVFLFSQSPGVLEGAFYKPSSIVGLETKDGGAGFKHNDVSSSMQKNPAERPPLLHTHTKKGRKGEKIFENN